MISSSTERPTIDDLTGCTCERSTVVENVFPIDSLINGNRQIKTDDHCRTAEKLTGYTEQNSGQKMGLRKSTFPQSWGTFPAVQPQWVARFGGTFRLQRDNTHL